MRVMLLAPHPLYQDRGTPIAVSMLLRVLSEQGHEIDVVTYHEGSDLDIENVTLHRIPRLPLVRGIRPGFSWKKLPCDAAMFAVALRLVMTRRYDLVHAVEESAFIARLLKWGFGIPYVYDMDSSLPQQMVEKFDWLAPIAPFMAFFEGIVVRNAAAVVPVCEALAESIAGFRPRKVALLTDVSLLPDMDAITPRGPEGRTRDRRSGGDVRRQPRGLPGHRSADRELRGTSPRVQRRAPGDRRRRVERHRPLSTEVRTDRNREPCPLPRSAAGRRPAGLPGGGCTSSCHHARRGATRR